MTDEARASDALDGAGELENDNADALDEVGVIEQADFDRVVSEGDVEGDDERSVHFLSTWLREARMVAGIDPDRVSVLCGIDPTKLRRIELGAVAPEAEELELLCALYGSDIDRTSGLLPRLPSRATVVDGILNVGTAEVAVGAERSNEQKLVDIAESLRQMRGLAPGAVVRIRATEIQVIGSVLDLEHDDLLTDLMAQLGLNGTESVELLAQFVEANASELVHQPA